VIAKAAASTTPEGIRQMLRALLSERFKLAVHPDTKPVPAFVLAIGQNKPKLRPASSPSNAECQPQKPEQVSIPFQAISCRAMTMEAFAQVLPSFVGTNYLPNPVVDSTGLNGIWDFDLKWVGRANLAAAGSEGVTIFEAIDKQLGLTLAPKQVPMPVVVVESVYETPTPNMATVQASIPAAPPAEFEVADIKPTMPDAPSSGIRILSGGRLDVRNMPLKALVTFAWNINNDDTLVGAPKWLESERFDVIAKASVTQATPVDVDTMRLMLRALLVSRFKLATHVEERPVNAYVLTAVKPKLTPSDPTMRTGCKEGPAPATSDARNSNRIRARLVTCRNMNMEQFATQLERLAPGYIRTSVFNGTGLAGAWDFSFNFSQAAAVQSAAPRIPDPTSNVLGTPDPNGSVSLLDALTQQLGLKLEIQKRPTPVLVLDHVEQKPTDN
jgi:uncharacterized protein (TIGR03435 family)